LLIIIPKAYFFPVDVLGFYWEVFHPIGDTKDTPLSIKGNLGKKVETIKTSDNQYGGRSFKCAAPSI
jgi:hypothetical protein